ncbi:MAG: cytochrome c biogenesis protein CcsA [Nitrospinae bacterium]|nr:cytochrome c biogenesis protein CcsA [Nitrospinota bacterium]
MQEKLFIIALFCYLISSVKYFLYLAFRRKLLFIVANSSVAAGFVVHTAGLVMRSIQTGQGPYTSGYEYTLFFSWAIILVYLIVEIRYRIQDFGSFVVPMGFLLLVYSLTLPSETVAANPAIKLSLTLHRTLSFLGYSAFALAFGAGIMYLLQERQLKSKKFGPLFYRLPSLEVIDDINHKLVAFGFPVFSIGFITGSMLALKGKGSFFSWQLSTLPLMVTWIIYGGLFTGRIAVGLRRKKAAVWAIIGFLSVMATYFLHVY